MPNIGKLLKQAKKMQQKMESVQAKLEELEIVVSTGGGAVTIKIDGKQNIKELSLDPEFLKEDRDFIEETLLASIQEALDKSKKEYEEKMSQASDGLNIPGI
jgi:nucleoid-associated protein EbfC